VRLAFVIHGNPGFNSDEVLVQAFLSHTGDFQLRDDPSKLSMIWGVRRAILKMFYLVSGNHLSAGFLFATLSNTLMACLWAAILFWRYRDKWMVAPSLVSILIPIPAIAYLGTQIGEFRTSLWVGALLVGGAGHWTKGPWRAFLFGVLSGMAYGDDPFVAFYALPVLIYEMPEIVRLLRKRLYERWIAFMAGVLAVVLLCGKPYWQEAPSGYCRLEVGGLTQWKWHWEVLTRAWPLYWSGALPYGYLQNSELGRWLQPSPWAGREILLTFLFWSLFFLGGIFLALYFKGARKERREAFLWLLPPALSLFFFIFGAQVWDSMSLRYLGMWQFFLPAWFGFGALFLTKIGKRWIAVCLMVALVAIHGIWLSAYLRVPVRTHPGAWIAGRLESIGVRSGYAHYWVSEVVRYYSKERVLLVPLQDPAAAWRNLPSVEDSKVVLVWVPGLDKPQSLPGAIQTIEGKGYRLRRRWDQGPEKWTVFLFEK
jgi:hypothetical protein